MTARAPNWFFWGRAQAKLCCHASLWSWWRDHPGPASNPPTSKTGRQDQPENPLPAAASPVQPTKGRAAWGGHGATWGHLAQARALELARARLWQWPWPHSQPRRGAGEAAGEAARYSWKPGGEVMLPECCNLRPDARGQLCLERSLPDFCSQGRLQVGRPPVLRAAGRGFLKEGGLSPLGFLGRQQNHSERMGL